MKTRRRPQVELLEGRTLLTAGALDTTFGGTGQMLTHVGGADMSRAVLVLPDGRVEVGGFTNWTWSTTTTIGLLRYNPDGSLDSTFGSGGKSIPFPTTFNNFVSMALTPDGKTVEIGFTALSPSGWNDAWFVTRTNANGTPDTTFGTGGRVVTDFSPGNDNARGVAVQPDGKILVVGYGGSTTNNWEVARYNVNGSLDSSFGTGGKVSLAFTSGGSPLTNSQAAGVTTDSLGRIDIVGQGADAANVTHMELVRLTPSGALDATFGGTGKVVTAVPGGAFTNAFDLGLQPTTGKIVVSGATRISGVLGRFAARFNPADGSLDTTFGPNGNGFSVDPRTVANSNGSVEQAIQPDGKIVLAGYPIQSGNVVQGLAVIRLTADGLTDASFGSNGLSYVSPTSAYDNPKGVAIGPDGKIVVTGQAATATPNSQSLGFSTRRFLGDSVVKALAIAPAVSAPAAPSAVATPDPTLVPIVLDGADFFEVGRAKKHAHVF